MSERKQQSWSVPLRVRFRSPAEQAQWEREHDMHSSIGDRQPSQLAVTSSDTQALQHIQHIKALLRLTNVLRAGLSLEEVLQQIATSISACTGFHSLVITLIEKGKDHVSPVAFAGVSAEAERIIREAPLTVEQMRRLLRPEFRISQSYFISHIHAVDYSDIGAPMDKTVDDYEAGGWHPEDALLVPLFSSRDKKKLLGLLSLDDPEDGKTPTLESIEVVELFANQAAIAIDNARIFQKREAEHRALEEAIAHLRDDLEQIQRGDLSVHVCPTHEKLKPIGAAINIMVDEISSVLGNVQKVTQAVDELTHNVQRSSGLLVRDANQQERQVQHISHAIDEIAETMTQLSGSAEELSHVAVEAMDVTLDGQGAIDRAVEGMGQVRESTLLSARMMKRLGESGQEINEAISAITDLTTRMNLVALNAAIEATRAGEQGQGFSVIAQEIRTLAVHSAEAARKVAAHIRTIQRETTAVSQSVEQNTHEAVKQTELVTQTGVALDAISIVTERMAGLVQGICTAADRQTQESQLVVSAVNQISQMTSDISEYMRHMQQSLSHLVELTNSLRLRLSVFSIAER